MQSFTETFGGQMKWFTVHEIWVPCIEQLTYTYLFIYLFTNTPMYTGDQSRIFQHT